VTGERSDGDPLQPPDRRRELLDLTLEAWQPLSSCQLSDEDAREILNNVTGFFGVEFPGFVDTFRLGE